MKKKNLKNLKLNKKSISAIDNSTKTRVVGGSDQRGCGHPISIILGGGSFCWCL
ncbi:hypothetical protein IMCC3317_36190 [Kordia antarctica]|uniref:Uncharacterized protein n=1 Tax=Kordia antarctica TaxID=1218801 RepID=A0A7L4ZNJ0_9FLAO|nr:hypothetical protein [Kordia antarctica]QHI38232.1 hypothetical protein IMCC3317_36190 [Kordia antarctica]